MPQVRQRQTHTEEYLAQAFWELYARKPIGQISVKELTERAGVNRSSFYGHFDDLYDLFRQEQEKLLEGIEAYIRETCQAGADKSPMEHILRYYRQNVSKLTLLCGEGGDPGFSVRLRERIVPELMDDLQIPPEDQEGYYILDFIISSMLSFLTMWFRREAHMPSSKMLASIRGTLLDGGRAALLKHSRAPELAERFIGFQCTDVE